MPVHALALSLVIRECVRRFEAEMLAKFRLEFSLRSHAFEPALEFGEEATGDVTVHDAVIERQA